MGGGRFGGLVGETWAARDTWPISFFASKTRCGCSRGDDDDDDDHQTHYHRSSSHPDDDDDDEQVELNPSIPL